MTPRDLGNITPLEIATGTHFHAQHDIKTNLVFLPADGGNNNRVAEASWSLFPSLVALV